jgi:hypothetical protein
MTRFFDSESNVSSQDLAPEILLFFKKETLLENRYGGMLMGFVTIHKGNTIGAAPQPMGVVGTIPLSGGVKDTHAIAQASRSNIGIFINQKDD